MKNKNAQNKATANKNQRGFTLVETTIASLVMLVGALGISSLFLFSTTNNIGGGERALAMAVAQQQLEQIRSVSFEDATLTVGTTTSTVTNSARTYTVQRVVANETNSDGTPKQLKRITIRVTPQSAPNWISTPVELATLRSTLAAGNFAVSQ
jgi:prepilin-type N-terminal cleavage/methylation domain-containing protein